MVFVSAGFACGAPAKRDPVFIEWGGSGVGSFVYSSMAAMSEAVNSKSGYIKANIQTTAGTSVHYQMLKNGDIDIGSGSGFGDIEAWNGGTANYPEPIRVQRTILVFSRNFQTVMVPVKSGIDTMNDLNGKRLAVGPAGVPSYGIAMGTLNSLGIQANFLHSTLAEQVELYKDGRVDCFFLTSAGGNSNVLDAANTVESKLISLTEEEMRKCEEGALKGRSSRDVLTNEFYSFIPPGEKINVMNDHSSVNVLATMDDQVVYDILDCYWSQHENLRATLKGLNTKPENILMATTYIHPGAARYYKEVWNIDIPAEKNYALISIANRPSSKASKTSSNAKTACPFRHLSNDVDRAILAGWRG